MSKPGERGSAVRDSLRSPWKHATLSQTALSYEFAMFQHIRTTLAHGFSQPILSNSIKIALVVGTMLNTINQGESIVVEGDVHWGSFLLNYMIPFCVSCYSASRHAMHRQ